jgi:hypothetical protein
MAAGLLIGFLAWFKSVPWWLAILIMVVIWLLSVLVMWFLSAKVKSHATIASGGHSEVKYERMKKTSIESYPPIMPPFIPKTTAENEREKEAKVKWD